MSVRKIENCAGKYLRTVRLGVNESWSVEERYRQNVVEIGWTSQLVRRVKLVMLYAFKLITGIVPLGSLFFQPFEFLPQLDTEAGSITQPPSSNSANWYIRQRKEAANLPGVLCARGLHLVEPAEGSRVFMEVSFSP